jgi:predicted Rossmann fold flavoprotein
VEQKTLIVIGGGAAGFFCAINAARLNSKLKVIILEKSDKLLSKVKVSGGGRCNVTHACFDIIEMSRQYPRGQNFVKKSFHEFFTTDTIKWFDERGIKLKTEEDGRMFPVTDTSQTIINCLLKEATLHNVEIRVKSEVKGLEHQNGKFKIQLTADLLECNYICIACGGYPKATMFDWLKQTGHTIEEPAPSLFTFNTPGNTITKLMGVSVENVKAKVVGTKLEQSGPLLITHLGLSGPAILKLSAWGAKELKNRNYEWNNIINWAPKLNEEKLRKIFLELRNNNANQKIINKNPFFLPARLWHFLAERSGIKNDWRWADLPATAQNILMKNIIQFECNVKGKTTFKEEFVTAGGIKLSEVNPNTMMSKKVTNLFFAGEVLDVDGITGGYNFQHAWTSGFIAAKTIAAL